MAEGRAYLNASNIFTPDFFWSGTNQSDIELQGISQPSLATGLKTNAPPRIKLLLKFGRMSWGETEHFNMKLQIAQSAVRLIDIARAQNHETSVRFCRSRHVGVLDVHLNLR